MEKIPENKITLQKLTQADIEAYLAIDKTVGYYDPSELEVVK